MQQYENEEAQQASIFSQTPSSQHATAVPTIGSETVPATAGVVGEVSVATNDANSTPPTCAIGVQPSTGAGPSTSSGTTTSECVDSGVGMPPPASFDCIEGTFSDHRFADRSGSATNARQFGRRVTKEWGLLSGSLPPGIYVRACEEHMDLLRAVMFGPAETPYEDSCFFFDVRHSLFVVVALL
jgi:ubiquitin-conjugating enzyme E2 O